MFSRDLPDMSSLALGSCIHIRQIPPSHVTYITCSNVCNYLMMIFTTAEQLTSINQSTLNATASSSAAVAATTTTGVAHNI